MKPKFNKAISDGDILTIRLFLTNELMLDPRGKSFEKMRDYAEMNIQTLYEQHDGASFEFNKEKWNKELLFSVKNDLDSNFSRERLGYYYDLAKDVLKEKATNLDTENEKKKTESENSISEKPINNIKPSRRVKLSVSIHQLRQKFTLHKKKASEDMD